ncbi:GNAT family N-acetyltransferase [Streptomyces sp. NPDC054956]
MTRALPRTIRAVDTDRLLALEREAAAYGFSQRLPVDWLREHVAEGASHYLFPVLVHQLGHRPEVSPQWRCQLLLTVRTGEQILSLLDVLPATFDELAETLDAASKTDIAGRMERARTQREWTESTTPEPVTTADDLLLVRARELWVELAGVPVAFSPSAVVEAVVAPGSRLSPPSWTGIVRIGDAAIATAPSARTAAMVADAARKLTREELVDAARLGALLPVRDVLGPASLFYLDRAGFLPAHEGLGVEEAPVGDGGVARLLALAGEEEAGESGLEDISSPAFLLRRGDEVVAAAGYRTWPRSVAHMSVLVAPDCRGRHLARAVASAAVAHALGSGLLPQWRARSYASQRVALALGFEELGTQLSVRLGA